MNSSILPLSHISATIRLQFHKEFTFDDAINYIPYFADLGISHIYSSPILTARQNSTHGYDIVDPTQINIELGGEQGLRRLVSALRKANLGLIVDIVPNHMGVGGYENPWWQHLLEWGSFSPYAMWFDVDWHINDDYLDNKVLAPFLGDPYGIVLDKGDIALRFNESDGRIQAEYFYHQFPIALVDYSAILRRADDIALLPVITLFESIDYEQQFNLIQKDVEKAFTLLRTIGSAQDGRKAIEVALEYYNTATIESRSALHLLLEKQHYRLTWWRNAADEINWRRFFEVSELAGVRVEIDEVFEATHSLIFKLYEDGLIDGVRLDHIDGLAHPKDYCLKLRERLEELVEKRPTHLQQCPYMIAEKILAAQEWLRPDWMLDGTTGYEFMDQVSALLHDPRGAEPLTSIWQEMSGDQYDFSRHVQSARRQLLSENLVGEFDATALSLHRIARADLLTRDYSLAAIKRVLTEILVHFPVYRTYVSAAGPDEIDREVFKTTAMNARRTLSNVDKPLVDIILSWLSAELVINFSESRVADLSKRAMTRFQQLTPPLLAKSVEDTAFYRYGRLLSRNEVGSDPASLSLSVADFHEICLKRQQMYPQSLLATATHDHKRGEDARARIAVLSQIPQRWAEVLSEWLQLNARFHVDLRPDDNIWATYSAPRPNHELMLYQTLIGAWPYNLALKDTAGLKIFAKRVNQWLLKSIREAKRISNWIQINESYESICTNFLFNILDAEKSAPFLQSLHSFIQEIAAAGAVNGLTQTLLRLTTPGVPDLYQGAELWDFSLVDPDNRRLVDYKMRQRLIKETNLNEKILNWKSGAIKQYIIHRTLLARKKNLELFSTGIYIPLRVSGPKAAHILAFMRKKGKVSFIIVTLRLTYPFTESKHALTISLNHLTGTIVHLPSKSNGEVQDILSEQRHHFYSGEIEIAKVLTPLPFALLRMEMA